MLPVCPAGRDRASRRGPRWSLGEHDRLGPAHGIVLHTSTGPVVVVRAVTLALERGLLPRR